jgi:hypothetical protein
MDWRNCIGVYGAYFLGLSGIGFALPYLPLYLRQHIPEALTSPSDRSRPVRPCSPPGR